MHVKFRFVVQGLQQRNLELLTVVRQLSAEKDQERADLEQEKANDREALEAEKNALHAERTKQQVSWQFCSPCQRLGMEDCSSLSISPVAL